MASRSPRRFRDSAAKFDWCTVNRVARCRGEVRGIGFGVVLMQAALVAAANVDGELEVFAGYYQTRRTLSPNAAVLSSTLRNAESCDARRSDLAVRSRLLRRLEMSRAARQSGPA